MLTFTTAATLAAVLSCCTPAGQTIDLARYSPSLAAGMLGADTLRFRVVLPPTYASDVTTRFPTLYFLPGFDTPVAAYADGTFQGLRIDSLPAWAVTPFILVILDGDKGLGGGFYATSPVGGDWSAAVLQELVPAVDSRFRTLRSPAGSSPGIRWAERGRFSSAWGTPRCLHTCSP